MIKGLKRFNLFRALSLTWIFIPFQWDYLSNHNFSPRSIFLLNAIFTFSAVLFEIPTGIIADKIGRKKALIIGGLSMSAGCCFFLIGGAFMSMGYFSMANIFAALSMTLISGCDSAYLYDLMAAQGALHIYPRTEGKSTAWKLIGNVAGGIVGFLIARISIEWTFIATAIITFTASIVAALLPDARIIVRGNLHTHLSESFSIVRKSRVILSVLFYSLFLFPLLRVGIFLDPPHASLHGIKAEYMGLAFALKDMTSALASYNAGRLIKNIGSGMILIILPLVAAISFLIQGAIHGPWCYLLYLGPAFSLGLFSPVIRIMINQAISESSRRATVLSVEGMFRRTGYAFFSPLIGWLLDVHTLEVVFISLAFLGLSAAGISATIAMLGNGIAREVRQNAERITVETPMTGINSDSGKLPCTFAIEANSAARKDEL